MYLFLISFILFILFLFLFYFLFVNFVIHYFLPFRILHDTVTFLQHHLHTEGLFRKTGSLSRQRELLSFMDRGAMIPGDSHTHDVANLMKRFFRELPEPLLTNRLLSCFEDAYNMFHTDKEKFHKVVLLLCLLLPQDHRWVAIAVICSVLLLCVCFYVLLSVGFLYVFVYLSLCLSVCLKVKSIS